MSSKGFRRHTPFEYISCILLPGANTDPHLYKVDYCDFCMCTFSQTISRDHQPSLHIEIIIPDDEFWQTCVDLSQHFFNICILPELLGRWYSRSHSSVASSSQQTMSVLNSEPMCGASSTMTSMPSTTSVCGSDQSLLIGQTSMLSASISNKLLDGTGILSNATSSKMFLGTAAV